MFTNQQTNMNQFSGLDVKITFQATNTAKKIKTPLTYNDLKAQVQALAQSRGVVAGNIQYMDVDGSQVVIEDEYDLEFGGGGLGGNSDGEVSADSDGDGGDAGSSGGLVGSLLAVVPGPAEIERDDFEYPTL